MHPPPSPHQQQHGLGGDDRSARVLSGLPGHEQPERVGGFGHGCSCRVSTPHLQLCDVTSVVCASHMCTYVRLVELAVATGLCVGTLAWSTSSVWTPGQVAVLRRRAGLDSGTAGGRDSDKRGGAFQSARAPAQPRALPALRPSAGCACLVHVAAGRQVERDRHTGP